MINTAMQWAATRSAWIGIVGLTATVTLFMLAWAYPTFPGDERALLNVQALQSDWLDSLSTSVSRLGVTWVLVPLILGSTLGFLLLNRRVDALIVLLSLAPIIAGNALKVLVDRPRPDYLIVGSALHSSSFPSGHSLYAMIFGGILIFLAGELIQHRALRRCTQVFLALVILAIGASRVYQGVHWPSDVLGGYVFGIVALVGLIKLRNTLVGAR